jgi:hypothetical protein
MRCSVAVLLQSSKYYRSLSYHMLNAGSCKLQKKQRTCHEMFCDMSYVEFSLGFQHCSL